MLFSWLRRLRRRRYVADPFPAEWRDILESNVRQYHLLDDNERRKLENSTRILLAEKNWEGCGGMRINDEVKVTIAGVASLLLLGFDHEYFDMVQSILVYPDAYLAKEETVTHGGVVIERNSPREGEAWYRGPVILSWTETLAGARGDTDGDNLVLHEFAHQLDMQNGRHVDGTPYLPTKDSRQRWARVLKAEYERLQHDCSTRRMTLLDCYGTKDKGEFFAVSTECFFERPIELAEDHPELYEILSEYYRQDPAARERRSFV